MKCFVYLIFYCFPIIYCLSFVERPNPRAPKGRCRSRKHPDMGNMYAGQSKMPKYDCVVATCLAKGYIDYETCGGHGYRGQKKNKKEVRKTGFPTCCSHYNGIVVPELDHPRNI